jgi:hypothetical protein
MIEMPDVDALMRGGLGDWLAGQQAARQETRRKIRNIAVGAVIVGAVLALGGYMAGGFEMAYFLGALVAMAGMGWAHNVRQKMINALKGEMNGALARSLGVRYQVEPATGAEFDLAYEYDLLPSYDDSYFQDQWQGQVENTDFLLYEVKLTETRGSGKNRRTVTVFRGILLRMHFARDFLGTTLVRRDGFKFTLFGDSKSYQGETLERVKMVDPRFEDAFDVYGSDAVEARYLVHPAYCERLLELERDFYGEQLVALFHKGDLLVTIQTNDMFESATLDPAKDRERLGQTIEQFASIARLIRTLNERPRG